MSGVVCKDMACTACDNIFGLEKQKMQADFEIKNNSKQSLQKHFEKEIASENVLNTSSKMSYEEEQDKVIKLFKNISKNPPKGLFEFPEGYNPKFMAKKDEFNLG